MVIQISQSLLDLLVLCDRLEGLMPAKAEKVTEIVQSANFPVKGNRSEKSL